jgi:membrane-bound lytic murein transglycosylase D
MLRSKGIIWILLPFFIGLFCPFLIPGKAQAEKENPPGSSSVATDKAPSAEPALKSSETEEAVKKQTAPRTSTRTYRQREAARNLPPQDETGNIPESEQDIMERVLELLNSSQDYWVKGDIENALGILDQAYAMLLDTNGDTDISRQKDDLRLLISKKILAIYTSKHTVTNGKRSEIPIVINAEVEREIRSFQTIERDFFIQAYQRASFFRPVVLASLKKAGLPEVLSWLPLVESGFKIRALSKARALGLWQFIPSTGYKYGLNRDDWLMKEWMWINPHKVRLDT